MEPGLRHEGAAERRAWILSTLQELGFVSITDLARELAVSQMTIRRDLHSLEATGDVRLVHGGASLTPHALHSAAFGRSATRFCVRSRRGGSARRSPTRR